MRLPNFRLYLPALLLVGCSSTPPPPSVTPTPQPTPVPRLTELFPDKVHPQINALRADPGELARSFLDEYRHQALYNGQHAATLARDYRFRENRWSTQQDRLMMVFDNHRGDTGFVAWSLSRNATATSLRVNDSRIGQRFALILRPARLCFAINAAQAPSWSTGRWAYDPIRPGSFECNGLTNSSAFQPGTRLPALLGAYYSEGDAVLMFDSRGQRDAIAGVLAQLFPFLAFSPR
ncbi:hypothetical protein [Marinobacterium rhizophilum]|uniref:Uncharacterized protein n=1 Tax=Marinobacterium rhizophilum TaxID=420402 RepID=A0ABY5HRD1_9GAMM|nr:hypothetical protein [Marinobacterium rhizophilum]UTW13730.1 hypothetical protein KDW95_08860 [Marinobacterium rhizophilum]